MSTKFPTQARDVPLPLLLLVAERRVAEILLARLTPLAPGLQPSHLALFAALDCGATHAAAAAERLGISRQAVARTAREMETMGLLQLQADAGAANRNLLVMTETGETLAREGRTALALLEDSLGDLSAPLRQALGRLGA
jgi:DNA-binding MarR family transcriptional regulator